MQVTMQVTMQGTMQGTMRTDELKLTTVDKETPSTSIETRVVLDRAA